MQNYNNPLIVPEQTLSNYTEFCSTNRYNRYDTRANYCLPELDL